MTDVPRCLADFDADFLSEVLGVSVDAVESERIAVGEGFLGELARLHLKSTDPDAPKTLIAKIPTTDSGMKPLGMMLGVYEREGRFYDEIAPKLQINVPDCLYNGQDGEDFALLLEDVGHLEGGDHMQGATLDQAYAAIDAAAGVHGRWWRSPELDKLDWVPAPDNPINLSLQDLYASTWPAVIDKFGHHFDEQLIKATEEFIPACSDFLTHYGEEFSMTLVHNDFRLDNMFFDGENGMEMTLIDWQIVGKGDGGGDLVPFLMNNIDTEMRREHETELVERYHRAMNEQGAGYANLQDVKDGLGMSMMFWLTAWGFTSVSAIVSNERAETLFDNVMRRATATARDYEAWQYTGDRTWKPTFLS
jgi:hypothetical protein